MKSKDKIVDSLYELMKNTNFEEINIKSICELAEINRSTYYRNFKSKEDIIKYKLRCIMDEYIEEFQSKSNPTKKEYLLCILETFTKYESFLKIIYKQKQIYLLQMILIEYFNENIKTESKKELYKLYYHIGGIYNFTICWIEHDMSDSVEFLAEIGLEIISDIDPYLWNKF